MEGERKMTTGMTRVEKEKEASLNSSKGTQEIAELCLHRHQQSDVTISYTFDQAWHLRCNAASQIQHLLSGHAGQTCLLLKNQSAKSKPPLKLPEETWDWVEWAFVRWLRCHIGPALVVIVDRSSIFHRSIGCLTLMVTGRMFFFFFSFFCELRLVS